MNHSIAKYLTGVIPLISFLKAEIASSQPWAQQPSLALDKKNNIRYYDPNSKGIKTIFPVMLYSFKDTTEADIAPLPRNHFWNQAKQWGFNVIYSWNEDSRSQKSFLKNCNQQNKLCMLAPVSSLLGSGIFCLADEPISNNARFDTEYFSGLRSRWGKKLGYLNSDVFAYYYRLSKGARDGFASKIPVSTSGSTQSYNELAAFADILGFDYYPYRPDGSIDKLISNVPFSPKYPGTLSVGSFTALMKTQYSPKPIWPVIQTLWYEPYYLPYKGFYVTDTIMRQLTFDAIIHGADGVSFFGHGQAILLKNKPEYNFLRKIDDSIWKFTLYVTKELKDLQEGYDQILLEDNVPGSQVDSDGIAYSFKKTSRNNKFYVFIVNSTSEQKTAKIKVPSGMKIVPGSIHSIGRYSMPAITGVSSATVKDYRHPKANGGIDNNQVMFQTTLYRYGTNILSMRLIYK